MKAMTGIDWTTVVNFDDHGAFRGSESNGQAEADLDELRDNGATVNEWHVKDPKGLIIRIVQVIDPEFGETDRVFPAECDDCGSPVTQLAWVSDEHHTRCPRRDPHF
ncbi:hypothetical protein [Streptomyces sp. f150]|uniref:hypothetical protein n=1 Tax=Streptomyces sp. f150 TaxID=1827699 RepID=UPI000BF13ED8|nr:hypothetical protein [Streptomyces sp. f150]